jgi:hypothetical protein
MYSDPKILPGPEPGALAPEADDDQPRLRAFIAYWDWRRRGDQMYRQSLALGWTQEEARERAQWAASGHAEPEDYLVPAPWPPKDYSAQVRQATQAWQDHLQWLKAQFGGSKFTSADVKMAATSMGWKAPPGTWHLDSPNLTRDLGLAYGSSTGNGPLRVIKAGTLHGVMTWRIEEEPATAAVEG